MPSAPAGADDLRACERLLAALPDELDPGVARRPVDGDATRSAAWGDPAVVLTCAAPPPDRLDEPVQVNDVRWSVRDIGAGYSWTTTELTPVVVVEVPDAYANPAEVIVPLAEPLQRTLVPATTPAPAPSP